MQRNIYVDILNRHGKSQVIESNHFRVSGLLKKYVIATIATSKIRAK